jgi:hypothetical protein
MSYRTSVGKPDDDAGMYPEVRRISRILKKSPLYKSIGVYQTIHDRVYWRRLVKNVTKVRVKCKEANCLSNRQMITAQDEICRCTQFLQPSKSAHSQE